MRILPRRNHDSEPSAAPAGPEWAADDGGQDGAGTQPPLEDAGATERPSRELGDIYIESNDADNTVFGDVEEEEEAREELRDLTQEALRATGAFRRKR